jgi:single-strand DNA-binding protein
MAGLPEITLIGSLTADPEFKFIPSGAAVANFTIASNDRRFDKATNKWVDGDATFVRCSLWRDYAENVAESLKSGQRVIAVGELKQRSYETSEGEKRSVYEVAVREIGPALKWATADIKKIKRTNGNSTSAASNDPWANPAPGGTNGAGNGPAGYTEEPPF